MWINPQAIVEIPPQRAACRLRLQVARARGEHAHVVFGIVEPAQDLALRRRAQPAKLRQIQRPAARPPKRPGHTAGGRVASQHQQRPAGAQARMMDRLRRQLLACSRLAGDEHAGGAGADVLDRLHDRANLRTSAHDVLRLEHRGQRRHFPRNQPDHRPRVGRLVGLLTGAQQHLQPLPDVGGLHVVIQHNTDACARDPFPE